MSGVSSITVSEQAVGVISGGAGQEKTVHGCRHHGKSPDSTNQMKFPLVCKFGTSVSHVGEEREASKSPARTTTTETQHMNDSSTVHVNKTTDWQILCVHRIAHTVPNCFGLHV